MANVPGIRFLNSLTATVAVTNSIALVTSGLSFPIAANQLVFVRWFVPFSLGATGGFRFQVVVPAAPTFFSGQFNVQDFTTPATFVAFQTVSAAFTNASAVAANYSLIVNLVMKNGATAGTVDLQFAQNNATANPITLLVGGTQVILFES